MKLTINLVTWNGAKYIPYLFKSLREQTCQDYFLRILDNASVDNTVELIKKELDNFVPDHELIVNQENLGFAGGHNQLYEKNQTEYLLIINQDLYLEPTCLEKLLNFLESNLTAAAIAPRTMKWLFVENRFSSLVDSLGLRVERNRRVVEIAEGQEYQSTISGAKEVFGVSGAVVMYRRVAIQELGYFFDADFHSYKEDVDLSFRLDSAGWKNFILVDAVAYHDRAGSGAMVKTDWSAVKNKTTQRPWVKFYSYKNHLMTLYKNEYWQNFLLDFPWIFWYELKKFVYFLIFDRGVLRGLIDIWRHREELRKKRQEIIKKRKVNWREIRKIYGKT